jgi:double-stranded uracil-DNA glycosylase
MTAAGFSAVSRSDARVLLLGTLPGAASLKSGEYYAQKRNVFWPIMDELMGIPAASPYSDRIRSLIEYGIALWDVCATADRIGSLDSRIHVHTMVPNDFATFFAIHARVRLIGFNGQKAAKMYEGAIRPTLPTSAQQIRCDVLPSTSAAYARIPFQEKLDRWRAVLASGID